LTSIGTEPALAVWGWLRNSRIFLPLSRQLVVEASSIANLQWVALRTEYP